MLDQHDNLSHDDMPDQHDDILQSDMPEQNNDLLQADIADQAAHEDRQGQPQKVLEQGEERTGKKIEINDNIEDFESPNF